MSIEIIFNKAVNAYAEGEIGVAEKLFRQLEQLDGENAPVLYFLGLIALDRGAYESASHLLFKAHDLDRENKDYLYSLAVAEQELGHLDEAENIYKKLKSMPEALNNLGNLYMKRGAFFKARKAFEEGKEKAEDIKWFELNLAVLDCAENEIQNAIRRLKKLLKEKSDFKEGWYQLGKIHMQNHCFKEAKTCFEKAVELDETPAFFDALGESYLMKNEVEQALSCFEKALSIDSLYYPAMFHSGLVYESLKRYNDAEKSYRDALRCRPDLDNALNNLGGLLYRQGRTQEALEMYRKVLTVNASHIGACFNLGLILKDLEEYEEAVGLFFNVLALDKMLKEPHKQLAEILKKWTDKEKAKVYAKGWLKHFPENKEAKTTAMLLNV
ncbi:MAG: tetratricopeptide repeat protein [Alphaproteobacteria bacterium]|nr:tetratricopeptide repeat protein [Alphaproteobacteria bacterium]